MNRWRGWSVAALLGLTVAIAGCGGEEPAGTVAPPRDVASATGDPAWAEAAQTGDEGRSLTAEGGASEALPYTGHVIRVLPIGAGLIQPDGEPQVPVLLDRPVVRNPGLLDPGQPVRFAYELNRRGLPSATDVLVLDGPRVQVAARAARRAGRQVGATEDGWRSGVEFTGEIVRYDAGSGGLIRMDEGIPLVVRVPPGLIAGATDGLAGRRVEFGFWVDGNEELHAYAVRLLP